MRPVRREEIVDYQTYEDMREELRRTVMAEKERRRVVLGPYLTFLFENPLTVRYQVQEMMRAERIVREKDIAHELATYNQLLGGEGELGATLLIGIDDPAERAEKLQAWIDLPETIYVRLSGGAKVKASFDPAQVGRGRLSAVQYLRFAVGGEVPVVLGVEIEVLRGEATLGPETRAALAEDLRSG